MSVAWELARNYIATAQKRQKTQHDKQVKNDNFAVGDRVFVYMPALKSSPSHKLAHPFKGPFFIREIFPNGAQVVPMQSPRSNGLRVALNRLRRCPEELAGSWDKSSQEATQDVDGAVSQENISPMSQPPETVLQKWWIEKTSHPYLSNLDQLMKVS